MQKVIRLDEVAELTGLSRTTIWRKCRAGEFPARIKLGSHSVGWFLHEVEGWLQSRQRIWTGCGRVRERSRAA